MVVSQSGFPWRERFLVILRTGGSWFFPLLLSAIPVFLGFLDLDFERQRNQEDAEQRLLQSTNQTAQQLRQASNLTFWAERAARQLRQFVETSS